MKTPLLVSHQLSIFLYKPIIRNISRNEISKTRPARRVF